MGVRPGRGPTGTLAAHVGRRVFSSAVGASTHGYGRFRHGMSQPSHHDVMNVLNVLNVLLHDGRREYLDPFCWNDFEEALLDHPSTLVWLPAPVIQVEPEIVVPGPRKRGRSRAGLARELPESPATEPTVSTADVAWILAVDAETVRRWIRRGDLPAERAGGELRVKLSALWAFRQRNQVVVPSRVDLPDSDRMLPRPRKLWADPAMVDPPGSTIEHCYSAKELRAWIRRRRGRS